MQVIYQQYGLNNSTLIEPGFNYYITLKMLSLSSSSEVNLVICSIPGEKTIRSLSLVSDVDDAYLKCCYFSDCSEDEEINQTINCRKLRKQGIFLLSLLD